MKTAVIIALFAGSTTAFAPVGRTFSIPTALEVASELEGMVGVDIETGNKLFDPLGLSDYLPPKWAREAELSNGRSAMLATVGWFWPTIFGRFNSDDVTTTDPIGAISQADLQWWAQFLLLCGVIEAYKYKKAGMGKSFAGDGDPLLDYSNSYPENEAARRSIELKELKNGRLAMIGFASFVAAHYIPGSVPLLS